MTRLSPGVSVFAVGCSATISEVAPNIATRNDVNWLLTVLCNASCVMSEIKLPASDTNCGLQQSKHSYVIPSAVEGPLICRTRHPSRRGPSTTLRMTIFWCLVSCSRKQVSFNVVLRTASRWSERTRDVRRVLDRIWTSARPADQSSVRATNR